MFEDTKNLCQSQLRGGGEVEQNTKPIDATERSERRMELAGRERIQRTMSFATSRPRTR